MAVSDSREVVIEASPEEILDVIADVETTPEWSSQHQSAEILETDEDGRPRRVKMKVKTTGITDEQVVAVHLDRQQRQLDPRQCESAEGAGRDVHADARRRQDQAQVRDHRRPVGAASRASCSSGR